MVTAFDNVREALEGNVYRESLWDGAYLVERIKGSTLLGSGALILQVYDLTKDAERAYVDLSSILLSRMHKISSRDLTAAELENLAYREAELEGRDVGERPGTLSERLSRLRPFYGSLLDSD